MPVPEKLRAAVEALAGVPHLLVALDFDGTLAPFVPRPEDARPLPGSAAALRALAAGADDGPAAATGGGEGSSSTPGPGSAAPERRTTTALLSGRHLSSLRATASPPAGTWLVGSHGAERYSPAAGEEPLTLTEAQAAELDRTTDALRRVAERFPGARLEHKPSGVVLHVRQCSDEDGAAALEAGRTALADRDVKATEGKAVLEAAVVRVDKGIGLAWLRDGTGADATVFVGDDVTDEHGFAVLAEGDLGVKVGDGATAAGYRLETLDDVTEFLELLRAVRHL
ncbi:trehalose-phosphatase [Zhihengliuella sp.]|uniref:trehalose-phosphatase n=1 Tax=Zhihengliuella sp. TaxID=1954483 RepID=UPI00281115E9|nr:trehalose-phosphatase [Zhihengliuella sp.]